MRLMFLHGLEGSPQGNKAKYFAAKYPVSVPAMDTSTVRTWLSAATPTDMLPRPLVQPTVEQLRAELELHPPELLVGSSYGGAIALLLAAERIWQGPMVLLAPAIFRFSLLPFVHPAPVVILHGLHDDIVPIESSRQWAQSLGAQAHLIELDDDHRLQKSILENHEFEKAARLIRATH